MIRSGRCWTRDCEMPLAVSPDGRFGLCSSCWWMAKTSFGIGAATFGVLSFLIGLLAAATGWPLR